MRSTTGLAPTEGAVVTDTTATIDITAPVAWKVGDRVRVVHADEFGPSVRGDASYVVTKVPTGSRAYNYCVQPVNPLPGERGLRAPGDCFRAETADERAAEDAVAASSPEPVAQVWPGSLVRTSARLRGEDPYRIWVVTKVAADRTVTLTRPGGWGGRHFAKIPTDTLTVLDPAGLVL